MQEYLFDKEALQKLIQESGADQNRIAITIDLNRPQDVIKARAIKFEIGTPKLKTTNMATDSATISRLAAPDGGGLTGCPNPPGC